MSTMGWGCHNFPLLALLVGADCIIHDDGIADELWKSSTSVEHMVLLQLDGETVHEMILLLFIGVNLLWSILRQMVEQL
jgi:hypothetical protein